MLRIGGKACQYSGTPIDLNVTVERISKEVVISTWQGNRNLGDVAVVRSGETELILVSKRALGYDLNALKELGLKLDDKQYVLLKHTCGDNHINVWDSISAVKRVPTTEIIRPKWPWDDNPFDCVQ